MVISRVMIDACFPRTLLIYFTHCPILIINSATFHSQKCPGLDVKYMVTLIIDVGWERGSIAVKTWVPKPNSPAVYLCIPDLFWSSLINLFSITQWHTSLLIQPYVSVDQLTSCWWRAGNDAWLFFSSHGEVFHSYWGPALGHRVLFKWRRVRPWKGHNFLSKLRGLC